MSTQFEVVNCRFNLKLGFNIIELVKNILKIMFSWKKIYHNLAKKKLFRITLLLYLQQILSKKQHRTNFE